MNNKLDIASGIHPTLKLCKLFAKLCFQHSINLLGCSGDERKFIQICRFLIVVNFYLLFFPFLSDFDQEQSFMTKLASQINCDPCQN
jgi:hypothetical protein